jgi:glutamate/tyrosine decarboxylase-like PLP-dependent enzyme
MSPEAAIDLAVAGLTEHQVHTPHPRYFGLFNPAPSAMGVAADALVAAFNPQIAAWSHSPWAAEVERHLVLTFASRFGFDRSTADGVFASGGMEANHTAVLCALTHAFPAYAEVGAATCGRPTLYTSAESHHSIVKAARMCGIGASAVKLVPVDSRLRMRVDVLQETIARDRAAGAAPFLIAATAGTTGAGAIDPLPEIAEVAERERIWFHVDAAWGGAAVLVPELRPLLRGIECAHSITFDAHKWLSVSMGAGMFLTRDSTILDRTFRVASAYMPKDAEGLDVVDPHLHSMQWSRRFIGLKLFLSLLVAGWSGYEQVIRHQTRMGDLLKERLGASGWRIVNDTPLPLVCFVDPAGEAERQKAIAAAVVASGEAWISTTVLGEGVTALRACITNYRTQPEDIEALGQSLQRARLLAASI